MKKILLLIIFETIFTALNLYADDVTAQFSEIEKEFYYTFAGSWDEEFFKDFEGTALTFSWGVGEEMFNASVLIDYNLWDNDNTWDFQGLYSCKIIDFIKINSNTFKIKLKGPNSENTLTDAFLIIHLIEDDILWFETPKQYEYSQGLTTEPDIPYGNKAYDNGGVLTGPDNYYYRRSGPQRDGSK